MLSWAKKLHKVKGNLQRRIYASLLSTLNAWHNIWQTLETIEGTNGRWCEHYLESCFWPHISPQTGCSFSVALTSYKSNPSSSLKYLFCSLFALLVMTPLSPSPKFKYALGPSWYLQFLARSLHSHPRFIPVLLSVSTKTLDQCFLPWGCSPCSHDGLGTCSLV